MTRMMILALALGLAFVAIGCGESDSDGDPDAGDTGSDTTLVGEGELGDFCDENNDCKSGYCDTYQNCPQDPDAVCAEGPPQGEILIKGNVRDFGDQTAIPNTHVKVTGVMDALMNPADCAEAAGGESDADGKFEIECGADCTTKVTGLVALVDGDGCYLSGTGLVEPEEGNGEYPPGIRNHDLKLVTQDMLDDWSAWLVDFDSSLADDMPLGEKGGVMASVRNVVTGEGVAGLTIESQLAGSVAQIYYLNEAGNGFNQNETASNGMFVVLYPSLAEKVDAVQGGEVVSRRPATLGETPGVIFTTTVHYDPDAL